MKKNNYKDIIQLGDIKSIDEDIIKSIGKIDLVLGGSPCQGFSRAGKGLNFEDSRSKLFFNFVDILNIVKKYNPSVKFLLENLPVAFLIDEYTFTKVLKNQCDAFSIKPNIVLKVHTFQYLLKLIKTSNFIGILPDVAKPEIPSELVKIPAPFLKAMKQNIVLAWNKRNAIIRPELKNVATYLLKNSQSF